MTDVDGRHVELRDTSDLEAIRRLALEAGLEDGPFNSIVYSCGFFEGDELMACAALKDRDGVFSVEWLAVDSSMRGRGLGRLLVRRIEDESRARGATRIWALARASGFFQRIGYTIVPPEDSPGPTIAGCLKCPQYKTACHPKIVTRELD